MLNRPSFSRDDSSWIVPLILMILTAAPALADDKAPAPPGKFTHRITGLFDADRVADLREAAGRMAGVELLAIDFEGAEATFAYDPKTLSPQGRAEEIVEQLDNRLNTASHHTFGVAPPSAFPREKRERIEIGVAGLDCKGCSLGAYESVFKLPGVERATASFKEGRVVAWIDPAKTNRRALEDALRARGIEIKDRSATDTQPAGNG